MEKIQLSDYNPPKLYLLLDRATGLFGGPGHYTKWTKKGKAWTGIGKIKAAINNKINYHDDPREAVRTWAIVEIDNKTNTLIPVLDLMVNFRLEHGRWNWDWVRSK